MATIGFLALAWCPEWSADATDVQYQPGAAIMDPESVTGIWEATLTDGRILGLSTTLVTSVPGAATMLGDTSQRIDSMYVMTYTRNAGSTKQRWWVTPSGHDAHVSWTNDFLSVHSFNDDTSTVDLQFDRARSAWSGTVNAPGYSGAVSFVRPARSDATAPIGTWMVKGAVNPVCIHVRLGNDRAIVLWMDWFSLYGRIQYVNELQRPERSPQYYGEPGDPAPQQHVHNRWEFKAGTVSGGQIVDGTMSGDGMSFSGTERHYGNGVFLRGNPPVPFVWTRASGDSCVDDLGLRQAHLGP